MTDGRRTSSIVRPRSSDGGNATTATTVVPSAATRAARAADVAAGNETRDGTLLGDLTRPIAKERQLVKGPGKRVLIGVAASVLVAALLAAFFVLPVKSWFRQRNDLAERRRELVVLTAANAQLAADVSRLQTPDGISEAARDEIGYVGNGENRITVTPAPAALLTLPTGWPFDGVTQIVAARTAAAAQPSGDLQPAVPATSPATSQVPAASPEQPATTPASQAPPAG